MNSDNPLANNDFFTAPPVEVFESIDDFIKELEAKERDLHISQADTVVEIEDDEVVSDEIAELEELVKSYEKSPPVRVESSLPVAAEPVLKEYFSSKERELAKIRAEVSKLTAERTEMIETFRRRQNDFDNFKKRIEREQVENRQKVLTDFAMLIFPVIDNLSRALDSAKNLKTEKSPDFNQFVQGIELVDRQLKEVLTETEIYPIPAVGKPFDPHLHEAAAAEPDGAFPPNTVIEEILKGYKLKDKVIRHSVVKVSSNEADDTASMLEF